jgi:hypothetical protein
MIGTEWIVLGFLLLHLLLMVGVLAALIKTVRTEGRRSKKRMDPEGAQTVP